MSKKVIQSAVNYTLITLFLFAMSSMVWFIVRFTWPGPNARIVAWASSGFFFLHEFCFVVLNPKYQSRMKPN